MSIEIWVNVGTPTMSFVCITHKTCLCDASYATRKYKIYRRYHVIFARKYETFQNRCTGYQLQCIENPHFLPPTPWKRGTLLCTCRPFYRLSDIHSISFDPFAWKLPNLVQWLPLRNICTLLIFSSYGQRSRSNCWSCTNIVHSIPVVSFVRKLPNLVQWTILEKRCSLLVF